MISYLIALFTLFGSLVLADDSTTGSIVGTWSSKSNSVFTGPGFFDPVDELLIEPALPGISYSFTEDGYWEEAIYQITPNPKNHSCPAAVLIYQHGTYTVGSNGTLTLTPFEVDGRQLLSQPCDDDGVSSYTRYTQKEAFNGYSVYIDPYHGRWRLDLTESTGEIMRPLYLVYRPPQMLPTITMNPTAAASSTGSSASSTANAKVKRDYGLDLNLGQKVRRGLENRFKTNAVKREGFNFKLIEYFCIGLMVVGAVMFLSPIYMNM